MAHFFKAEVSKYDGRADSEVRQVCPVRTRDDWPLEPAARQKVRWLIVLDTETTGIDPLRHSIIEIAAARVAIAEDGSICALQTLRSGLRDPGQPLSKTIQTLTGLTDGELAGRSIDPDGLASFLAGADGIVAFNASFDRPHVETLLGYKAELAWCCAMRDIAWRDLGFEPGSQGYLLMQAGYYNPAKHRARDDVLSLVQLIDHRCADGETVAAKLLTEIGARQWRFEAQGAHFNQRHALKDQGYRWSAHHKLWSRVVRSDEFREQYRWYKQTIGMRPAIVPLPATQRYLADYAWTPVPARRLKLEWDQGDPF